MARIEKVVVLAVISLIACNPTAAATEVTVPAIVTEPPPASSTPAILSAAPSPIATEEIYPTASPWPTSTTIPPLQPGQPLRLANIYMSDEQNGWGLDASEHIIHTTDGGRTWKDVTPHQCTYRDSGFFALDARTAWASPYSYYTGNCAPAPIGGALWGAVWHTSDGGNTWQEGRVCLWGEECNFNFGVPPGYYDPVAIHFVDKQNGWLLVVVEHVMHQDRYRVYQTKDGGTDWLPIADSMEYPWTMNATGLAFQDEQTGWFSTSEIDGATDPVADWSIYRSSDAGVTWNDFVLPVPDPLPEAFAGNTAWCGNMGVTGVPLSTLGVTIHCRVYTNPLAEYDFYFHSVGGGEHWTSWLKTGDVEFIAPGVGWRSTFNRGAYDLEQTRDAGQTWVKLKTVQWNGDLEFVNERVGWALATTGETTALVHTTDGGRTWEEIKPVAAPS